MHDKIAGKTDKFELLVARASTMGAIETIIVHPCEATALESAIAAAKAGLIIPIIVAPQRKLAAIAASIGLDLTGIELIDVPHSHAAAAKSVSLIRAGRGELLMKGSLHSDELLHAVTDREIGLRTERRSGKYLSRLGRQTRYCSECHRPAYRPETRRTARRHSIGRRNGYTEDS